jgi:hypothetical protein
MLPERLGIGRRSKGDLGELFTEERVYRGK